MKSNLYFGYLTMEMDTILTITDDEYYSDCSNNEVDFIPMLQCGDVVNGVVKVTVTNYTDLIHASLGEDDDDDASDSVISQFCLEIKYNTVNSENAFRSQKIMWSQIGEDGIMFWKVPVDVNPYNFQFTVCGIHLKSGEHMDHSPKHSIAVPSFLKDNDFKKGEFVIFREMDSFQTTKAKIIEVLDDDRFKVTYYKYDVMGRGTEETTETDISRLYHESTIPELELDLVDYQKINESLILQTAHSATESSYYAIQQSVRQLLQSETIMMYGFLEARLHWTGVTEFVSFEIFRFLFAPQFKFAVDCLLDGDAHRALEMRNLRQSDIRTKYQLMKLGTGNIRPSPSMHNRLHYSCDWCQCAINEWEMVFQCTADRLTDRHDFCKRCVGTVVLQNQGLNELLCALLKDELIEDCVAMIVSFVIGRVIFTEFAEVENEENDDDDDATKLQVVGIKRNLEESGKQEMEEETPPIKRLKMS